MFGLLFSLLAVFFPFFPLGCVKTCGPEEVAGAVIIHLLLDEGLKEGSG